MKGMKKVNGTAMSIFGGIGLGLLTSMVITLAGAAVAAWLVTTEKIGEGTIGYIVMVIIALSAAAGALMACGFIKRLRLQVCMLSACSYFLTLLAMTAMLFGGQYQGVIVTAVIILITCVITAFIPSGKSRIGKRGKKAYR